MLRICVPLGGNSLLCRDWSQVQLAKETAFQIPFWHSGTCGREFPPTAPKLAHYCQLLQKVVVCVAA